jgi:hypothetical protein
MRFKIQNEQNTKAQILGTKCINKMAQTNSKKKQKQKQKQKRSLYFVFQSGGFNGALL